MLGLIWSSVVPLWEGFDEPAHYAYIQHMAENKELPTPNNFMSNEIYYSFTIVPISYNLNHAGIIIPNKIQGFETNKNPTKFHSTYWQTFNQTEYEKNYNSLKEISSSSRSTEFVNGSKIWEAQQAPLNYLLLLPIYKLLSNNDIITIVFTLRYVGIVISAIAIFFVYKTVTKLFKNQFMRYGTIIFTVFNPMFVSNWSRLSNETLNFLLFTLFFYFTIKYLKEDHRMKNLIFIGIILGLGLLTKQSFVSLLILVPVIIIFKIIQQKSDLKNRISYFVKNNLIIISLTIIISSWWYLRNLVTTGNLSGIIGVKSGPSFQNWAYFGTVNWYGYFKEIFKNFWGLFGWSFIRLPDLYYYTFMVITLISFMGLVFFIIKNRKKLTSLIRIWKYQSITIFCLCLFVIIIGMMYINFQYYLESDRKYDLLFTGSWYSFAAASALSILFIGGLKTWIDRLRINLTSKLPFFMLISMVLLNFYVICSITAYYYGV
jgi:4-amino-4-deoxy-L-arabinose transferase-like glycosyltransferase